VSEAGARKIYEERVVRDSLARLAMRLDLRALPFSDEELTTLARRSREAFRRPKRGKARLERCAGELGKQHGAEPVIRVVNALEAINNEIGYEEK
jgi:hypothetical protein